MANSLLSLFTDFISLFFPRSCQACRRPLVKGEQVICTACLTELPYTDHHIDPQNHLYSRISLHMPVRTAMAFLRFSKGGRVQRLLHALKYGNRPEVGEVLGSLCGVRVYGTDLAASADLIIPVPLHISRQRKRGYNQSARFAEGLSKTLKIPYSDTFLERTVKTETQTRKSRIARWENVQHAFRVKVPREIAGKNIVLVDDVVTTGATLQACIHVLMAAGCAEVRVICIAEA